MLTFGNFPEAIQFRVDAATREQFRPATLLNDATALDHDDSIDVVDRRQPMGRDQRCSAAHEFFDRFHDRSFGRRIERRSWFVEKKDRRIFQKRPRDPDSLTLPNAQLLAAFADLCSRNHPAFAG